MKVGSEVGLADEAKGWRRGRVGERGGGSEAKARSRARARGKAAAGQGVSHTVVALSNQVRRAALCSQFLIEGLSASVAMRSCGQRCSVNIERMCVKGASTVQRGGARVQSEGVEEVQRNCREGTEVCREHACRGSAAMAQRGGRGVAKGGGVESLLKAHAERRWAHLVAWECSAWRRIEQRDVRQVHGIGATHTRLQPL